jgi:transcription elongation GreA/GreB family factor
LISIASPIGRSLVGRAPGDELTIEIPVGRKRYEVLTLQTIHDKPND